MVDHSCHSIFPNCDPNQHRHMVQQTLQISSNFYKTKNVRNCQQPNLCVFSSAIKGVDPDCDLVKSGSGKGWRAGYVGGCLLVRARDYPVRGNPTQVLYCNIIQ